MTLMFLLDVLIVQFPIYSERIALLEGELQARKTYIEHLQIYGKQMSRDMEDVQDVTSMFQRALEKVMSLEFDKVPKMPSICESATAGNNARATSSPTLAAASRSGISRDGRQVNVNQRRDANLVNTASESRPPEMFANPPTAQRKQQPAATFLEDTHAFGQPDDIDTGEMVDPSPRQAEIERRHEDFDANRDMRIKIGDKTTIIPRPPQIAIDRSYNSVPLRQNTHTELERTDTGFILRDNRQEVPDNFQRPAVLPYQTPRHATGPPLDYSSFTALPNGEYVSNNKRLQPPAQSPRLIKLPQARPSTSTRRFEIPGNDAVTSRWFSPPRPPATGMVNSMTNSRTPYKNPNSHRLSTAMEQQNVPFTPRLTLLPSRGVVSAAGRIGLPGHKKAPVPLYPDTADDVFVFERVGGQTVRRKRLNEDGQGGGDYGTIWAARNGAGTVAGDGVRRGPPPSSAVKRRKVWAPA